MRVVFLKCHGEGGGGSQSRYCRDVVGAPPAEICVGAQLGGDEAQRNVTNHREPQGFERDCDGNPGVNPNQSGQPRRTDDPRSRPEREKKQERTFDSKEGDTKIVGLGNGEEYPEKIKQEDDFDEAEIGMDSMVGQIANAIGEKGHQEKPLEGMKVKNLNWNQHQQGYGEKGLLRKKEKSQNHERASRGDNTNQRKLVSLGEAGRGAEEPNFE